MDQSPSRGIGRQKTATVIFNRECPKVVDRFRRGRKADRYFMLTLCSKLIDSDRGRRVNEN